MVRWKVDEGERPHGGDPSTRLRLAQDDNVGALRYAERSGIRQKGDPSTRLRLAQDDNVGVMREDYVPGSRRREDPVFLILREEMKTIKMLAGKHA